MYDAYKVTLALLVCAGFGACAKSETDADVPGVALYDAGTPYAERRVPMTLPATGFVLAPDPAHDRASVVDLATLAPIGAFGTGRDPVDRDGPVFPAIDRGRGVGYLVLPYPDAKLVYGPHTERAAAPRVAFLSKVRLADLRIVDEVRTDVEPSDFALSADGTRAVMTFFQAERLSGVVDGGVVDDRRGLLLVLPLEGVLSTVFPKRVVPCAGPSQIALRDPTGDSAYVACFGDDAVASLTGLRGTPQVTLAKIPGAIATSTDAPTFGPKTIALSSGGRLAVAGQVSKDVRILEPNGAFAASAIAVGGVPGRLAWSPDGSKLFVAVTSPPSVVVIDAATLAKTATRDLGADGCVVAASVVVVRGGKGALVTCLGSPSGDASAGDGLLLSLDLESPSLATIGAAPLPGSPENVAVQEAP